jgi:type VI secretion system protein ImpH
MAPPTGRTGAGLSEALFREAHRFDFFQAVRLLEHLLRASAEEGDRRPCVPVGVDGPPEREVVRFRVMPALSFPAGAVGQIRRPEADEAAPPPEMLVTFFGLTGPSGVLPHHYTALLLRRLRLKDTSLRDFLDQFNHRMISLFYRVWEKYRLPFTYERSRLDLGGGPDPCTQGVYCLAGLGTGGLRGRLEVDDEAFLFYSGHFAHYPRSALALECVLEDYFEVPVRVQQLHGQWLLLASEDRSVLPGPAGAEPLNNQVGVSLVAGERCWDVQSKFRLQVGPLTYEQFRRLMPNGDGLRAFVQLARTYAGPEFDLDVQPVLLAAEVPKCRLDDASFLGWNTWLRDLPSHHDAADTVFSLEDI